MKKKLISALLTVVMIMTLVAVMCQSVLAAPIELTVGKTYGSTFAGTITSDTDIGLISSDAANPGVVTTDSITKNGITVTAILTEDKKSVEVTYSGTPAGEGTTEFKIKYATAGEEKSYAVSFTVVQPKTEETKPEDTKPEDTKPEETKPEDTKPEDTKPEDTKPEDTKPEDTKPEDTKPEDTKPENTEPEEELPPEVLAPEITSQKPENKELTYEQTDPELTFSVAATGNGTVSYRWRVDGTEVGTGKTFTLVPADMTVDTHTVECVVSNTIDDTTKHTAVTWKVVIEKSKAPVITSEATEAKIDGTGTAEFEVTAEGEELKYQWYLVKGTSKERVVDGKYGIMEYSGAETSKLTVTCTMAPKSVSTKFICEAINPDGLLATSGEYVLNITEDPDAGKVQKIEVVEKPDRTEYMVGETLDEEGLKIAVTTGKGTEEVTTGFVCTPSFLEEEGEQTITVSYGGKTTTFTVTVNKAPHEHKWTNWKLDDSTPVRVYRECIGGDDCTAKEVISKESFIVQYPTLAAELGLKMNDETDTGTSGGQEDTDNGETENVEDGDTGSSDSTGNINSDNTGDDGENKPEDNKKPEGDKNKDNSSTVLWIIIIIALILLAAVITYYFTVYKKPYKKPNSNNKMNK